MLAKYWRHYSQSWSLKDCYSVLGLQFGADSKEVRAAYLKLAKQYHPDAPSGDTEKFKKLAQAYEILNDPRNKLEIQSIKNKASQKKEPPRKKKEYKEENFRGFEEEEKAYHEWREGRTWSKSEKEDQFKSEGYEYHDPFMKSSERYTYSQFKRDKYNKSYKEPSKPSFSTSSEPSSSSYSSTFLALSCLFFLGASRL
jgi:curved DNA-binding protein CbpA